TPVEMANGLQALNGVFAAPDSSRITDTTRWNSLLKWPKVDKLVLTGAVALRNVPYAIRAIGGTSAPLTHNRSVAEPSRYALDQNYPNPFNPTTNIKFNLQNDGLVTLKVFNILGQEVITLANREEYSAGSSEVQFNASNLPSGVYFYRILVNDTKSGAVKFMETHKMMLVK
ncbi:MAG TPA: T9SS type A sorting domain-containing protein, partial [Bacteroidota bacterium]|nr:T9SS type A sorting domain-containing protein [Bacteroidota bacterium]